MRKLLGKKVILILILLAFVPPVIILFFVLEGTPAVSRSRLADVENAALARQTVKRSIKSLRSPARSAAIEATEEDLNAIMSLVSRGIENFAGHVEIASWGLHTAMTIRVPHNPIGDYINLRFGLEPSESGLRIFQVSLGRIEIPGRFAVALLRLVLNRVLAEDGGTMALNAVQSVRMDGKKVTLIFNPVPELKARFKEYKNVLKEFRDEVAFLGDPSVVRIYYTLLQKQAKEISGAQVLSLAEFMRPLFRLAKDRSIYKSTDPADENQAALLALSIFLGSHRFESLIGGVRTEEMKMQRIDMPRVVLGNREDLRLHFIYSAGIKLVSDRGITSSIGEFKELLDAGRGGSGFSFADLAADRAGTRFAEVATDRSGGAIRLQTFLAENSGEETFFPEIIDLPEGLSKDEFERHYVSIEAPQYLDMVNEIDSRITRLPVYVMAEVDSQ